MKFIAFAAALLVAVPLSAKAAPADDALHAVTQWLDKFNAGDMDAFFAGHATNPVLVDEFPPFIWSGKDAPAAWAKDFSADAKGHAVSDPHMNYGAPLRAESDGKAAYIVLPTVYHIKQGGKAMSARGSMTFVMTHADGSWKVSGWTYSAPAPTPDAKPKAAAAGSRSGL